MIFIIIGGLLGWNYFFRSSNTDFTLNILSVSLEDYPDPPDEEGWVLIPPGEFPISNPLKGFMPYAGDYSTFNYSMEYTYIPVNEIVNRDPNAFDFKVIEDFLDKCSTRGHHGVFRLYFDYPDEPTAIPQYILDSNIIITQYDQYGGGMSPDYDHPLMLALMDSLITRLGEEYDGDPRIGFIEIGLLGHWGEWHTYPTEDLFANHTTQHHVLEWFDTSFNQTQLLARYPNAISRVYDVGFHDDSFAFETIGDEDWYFYNQLDTSNMLDRWEKFPIGGEVRPEIQTDVFKTNSRSSRSVQNISECISKTHASWMLITSIFEPKEYEYGVLAEEDLQKAKQISQFLGYTFGICYALVNMSLSDINSVSIKTVVQNFGVAPFYYDWPVEIGILASPGEILWTDSTTNSLKDILPGEYAIWNFTINSSILQQESASTIALRVANPLENGLSVQFANNVTLQEWVIVEELS